MQHVALFLFMATCFATVAAAQNLGNLKQNIQNQLQGAQEERAKQMEEATGKTPPPPTATGQSPIRQGWTTRQARDGKTEVRLYFAHPQNLNKAKPVAGLVVLQEWWGVNDDIQERVREFAQHGYYAVAPDLYHGKVTADPTEAQKHHDAMSNTAAMIDMKTATDLLEEEATNGVVDRNHITSIGWCMGGEQSLLLSLADPRIKATVIFYGPLVTDPQQLKQLQGPVLGIFGNNDKAPSPADVERFRNALKAAGKTDVTIYQVDGVGHAFASKAAAKLGLYNEEKSKEAWAKLWTWLDKKR
ncbi:MAG: dienelactone hydrolase family protein [Phycisphaerales bacterium]|nr:dienelactone hydrolase family protein [Phycisphaerales bacterium]